MIDAAPLLSMIHDAPEDDGPRLVYADWLEEDGQADRALFIRVQWEITTIEAANGSTEFWGALDREHTAAKAKCHCRRCALRRRERELLLRHSHEWLPRANDIRWIVQIMPGLEQPCHDGRNVVTVAFARGFPHAVAVAALRDWVGGPCQACGGDGLELIDGGNDQRQCETCRGTGHAPGIGPAVMRAAPTVRVVTCEDRRPTQTTQPTWNENIDHPDDDESSYLPPDVFSLLEGGVSNGDGLGHRWRSYPTAALAATALSDALIRHAMARQPAEATA